MARQVVAEISRGTRHANGTDFPVVDQLVRDGRAWVVVRELWNGVPRTAEVYKTRAEAKQALGTKMAGRKPRGATAGSERIAIRATEDEVARWKASAEAAGVSMAEWIRRLANGAP